MERNKMLLIITDKIATLETEMFNTDFNSDKFTSISNEIDALRIKLQNVMNSNCPLIKN